MSFFWIKPHLLVVTSAKVRLIYTHASYCNKSVCVCVSCFNSKMNHPLVFSFSGWSWPYYEYFFKLICHYIRKRAVQHNNHVMTLDTICTTITNSGGQFYLDSAEMAWRKMYKKKRAWSKNVQKCDAKIHFTQHPTSCMLIHVRTLPVITHNTWVE